MANNKKQEIIDLTQIKEELTDYINIQIKKNFTEELERTNKALIKEKNKKIFIKNIEIIILLSIIIFLSYLLYDNHYYEKYLNLNKQVNETKQNNNQTNEENIALEQLIFNYGYLVENLTISETSSYLSDYYNGNLTKELRNYLTMNTMDFEELTIEDDTNLIEDNIFQEQYNKLFKDNYESSGFDYNEIKVRYLKKLETYITDSIIKPTKSNIKKEIINIEVNENEVIITTIEGVYIDNNLYNILTNEEITSYQNDSFTNYEKDLNKVIYTFIDNKLISIK